MSGDAADDLHFLRCREPDGMARTHVSASAICIDANFNSSSSTLRRSLSFSSSNLVTRCETSASPTSTNLSINGGDYLSWPVLVTLSR
jgi:hypothetical protein